MSKVVCVLYDDPVKGYPKKYARDDLPKLTHYPGGQSLPTPQGIDFRRGTLLGSVSGELSACASFSVARTQAHRDLRQGRPEQPPGPGNRRR